MTKAVEIVKITKTFPGVKALSNVEMSVKTGEVHAIVGENGAGKSTLMKILGGVYRPDDGQILIHGKAVVIKDVSDSVECGISIIYQELNLMPELTVSENVFITELPKMKATGIVRRGELYRKTRALMERVNIELNPDSLVNDLSVSEKQMVEILKALSHDSSIIVMDEPTAALSNVEVSKLYSIIETLKARGKTIIYISHRLKEIFDIADRVTVLRDGSFVATKDIKSLTQDDIVRLMVGRSVENFYNRDHATFGDTVIEIDHLSCAPYFQNLSFSVRSGEVLGIAGLMGCGREELAKVLYGLLNRTKGRVLINGIPTEVRHPREALRAGIQFVTEDRKDSGIFPLMSVKENLSINIIKKLCNIFSLLINTEKENRLLESYTKFMNLKYASDSQRVMFLSGGNQQKVVLARALAGECRVLILLEPTRGIDVGAKAEIYDLLGNLAKKGIAVIMISSDLPELITQSDRVLVMFQGQITGLLERNEMDEERIMQYATGTHFGEGFTGGAL